MWGALLRIGAGLAARAGVRRAASSLAGAAVRAGRRAAGAAARGAAGGPVQALANYAGSSARQITGMLRGQAAQGASAAQGAAQGAAAQAAAGATAQGAQAGSAGMQAMIRSSSAAGQAGQAAQGGGPASGTWRVTEAFNSIKQFGYDQLTHVRNLVTMGRKSADEMRRLMQTTADKTSGMDEAERAQRLRQNGFMPSQDEANMHYGTPNATQEQRVNLGEQREEAARQKNVEELERGAQANREFISGIVKSSLTLAGLPSALASFIKGTEMWATAQAESLRKLARYDSKIAGAFARLDYGDLRRTAQQASANSGSTSDLIVSLDRLRDSMQPFRELSTTFFNVVVTKLTRMADFATAGAEAIPMIRAIMDAAQGIEAIKRDQQREGPQAAFRGGLRDLVSGQYNRRP